jgi:hypothetical protein
LIGQQAASCHRIMDTESLIPRVGKVLQWQDPRAHRVSGVHLHLPGGLWPYRRRGNSN